MKVYIILIVLSVLVNLFGSTMYLGPPGLQFILTYLTVLVASILTLVALFLVRKSKYHITITLVILLITILTGLPLWLQDYISSGQKMKLVGQICYGVGIPLQIILLIISIKNKTRLYNTG